MRFPYESIVFLKAGKHMHHAQSIKIHEAIAFTAIAPLLNLNLNYEKLRVKCTIFLPHCNYA
jgi:hypothetical protein